MKHSDFPSTCNQDAESKTHAKQHAIIQKEISNITRSPYFYSEILFHEMLNLETKRNYRKKNPFLLISIDTSSLMSRGKHRQGIGRIARLRMVHKLIQMMHVSTRDIDIKGWFRENQVIGIICTEIEKEFHKNLVEKIQNNIIKTIDWEYAQDLIIRWKSYPADDPADDKTRVYSLKELAQDLNCAMADVSFSKKIAFTFKRVIDIAGSLFGIILFSPFFIILPILIKLNSKGPTLFRQERVGRDGKIFKFLKFRSMYINNDNSIHKEFVTKLIKGDIKAQKGDEKNAYKMKDDPRITKIGKFIRKTSLDELPQLFNVLMGNMSLVGPRPPIPYEVEKYDRWHTRRVLDVKPGITGYWQVEGRSSTTFDAMVRMDLQYVMNWSLWLDIKLIFKTPFKVLAAKGAC